MGVHSSTIVQLCREIFELPARSDVLTSSSSRCADKQQFRENSLIMAWPMLCSWLADCCWVYLLVSTVVLCFYFFQQVGKRVVGNHSRQATLQRSAATATSHSRLQL